MSSQMDPRVIKHGKTSNLLLDKNTTCPPRFVGFYHGKACQKKTALQLKTHNPPMLSHHRRHSVYQWVRRRGAFLVLAGLVEDESL